MKAIISILFLFMVSLQMKAQGIQFFEGSFEQAIELAKKEGKLIFVDAFAEWCGPCKRMKNQVFPNKKAGDFYNRHFVNMAIDMEKQMGIALNQTFNVRSYPTFLFIDTDGKILYREVGGKSVDLFIRMGEEALKKDDKTEEFEKQYNEGARDYVFMLDYIKSLNRAGRSASAVIYKYLSEDQKLSTEQKATIIYEGITHCDSKLFEYFTRAEVKQSIMQKYSPEAYESKLYNICWATAAKGFEFNVPELIEEAKQKYKKSGKNDHKKFSLEVDLDLARKTINPAAYLKAGQEYIKTMNTSQEKIDFILEMKNDFLQHDGIAVYSEDTLKQLVKKEKSIIANFACAKVLLLNKKYEESIPYLDTALRMAEEKGDQEKVSEINKLKSSVDRMLRK